MKEIDNIKRIFKLYLEGRTNSQQEEKLFRYLANPKNKDSEFHDLMDKAWQDEPLQRDDSQRASHSLEQIWDRLEQKKQKKAMNFRVFKYAASVTFFISVLWGWYSYNNRPVPETQIELISKTTQVGEKVKMILPDSSIVYLSGGTKLTWPSRFLKGRIRNVRLEGEAFFEVKRDTSSPFIIQSGKMRTQVLGTSFNVYAYPQDKEFSVAVRTGKVKVSESIRGKLKALSLLTPGMKLVYSEHSGKYAVNTGQVDEVNGWIDNKFVFRDKELTGILEQLERYYDVDFELKNPKLAHCRFNATFSNKSIRDVMEQIRIMSGSHIKYRIDLNDKKIALWGEGCQ